MFHVDMIPHSRIQINVTFKNCVKKFQPGFKTCFEKLAETEPPLFSQSKIPFSILSKSGNGSAVAPVPAGVRLSPVRKSPEVREEPKVDEKSLSNDSMAARLLTEAATEDEATDVKKLMAVMKKANRPTETFIVSLKRFLGPILF
jgi:hypothetical protein